MPSQPDSLPNPLFGQLNSLQPKKDKHNLKSFLVSLLNSSLILSGRKCCFDSKILSKINQFIHPSNHYSSSFKGIPLRIKRGQASRDVIGIHELFTFQYIWKQA